MMSEHRRKRIIKLSNLTKSKRKDTRIIREYQADHEAQSGHEPLRQYNGGGVIVTNDPDLIDFSKNTLSTDLSVDCI